MLEGVRILEFGEYVAAPVCSMLLADQGAEVMKLERPEGDPLTSSPAYQTWNRNKRVVRVDLKSSAGVARASRLAANADVIVDGLKPGLLSSIGLDGRAMLEGRPELIYCSLRAFPQTMQMDIPAWEPVISAMAGLYRPSMFPHARELSEATFTPLPFSSIYAGMLAATSVAAALFVRARVGQGQLIEIPILGAMFLGIGIGAMRVNGVRAWPAGAAGTNPLATAYQCADGKRIYVAAGTPRHLEGFISTLGLEKWRDEQDWWDKTGKKNMLLVLLTQPEIAANLYHRLCGLFLEKSSDEWEDLLSAAGLPSSVCRTSEDWLKHPHAEEARLVVQVHSPLGTMRQPGRLIQTEQSRDVPLKPCTVAEEADADWLTERHRPTVDETQSDVFKDVRVLDLTAILAGPTCGRVLAEWGADVIKIDPPTGGIPHDHDSLWLDTSRGKRSLLVDLKTEAGREILWKLIETADVFIENFNTGVIERLGFGYEEVSDRCPRIIFARMNCYGHTGPFAKRPGYEELAQAATGMQVRYGGRDGLPQVAPYAVCDYGTGIALALGVLVALHEREQTGHGRLVTTSLASTAGLLQSFYMFDYGDNDRTEIEGQEVLGFSALSRLYRCLDDWIYLHCPPDRWIQLSEVAAIPTDQASNSESDSTAGPDSSLADRIGARLATKSVGVWLEKLKGTGVGAARAATIDRIFNDPNLRRAGLLKTLPSVDGRSIDQIEPSHRLSMTPARTQGAAPPKGAHSTQILRELGYSEEDAAQLLKVGVVTGL